MKSYINKKQTLRQKKLAVKKYMLSKTCKTSLILFIFAFGLMYLLQTNAVSSKGFELSDLEIRAEELKRETQKLEVEISKYRSIQSIQERLQDMDMVAADNMEYLNNKDAVVVRR